MRTYKLQKPFEVKCIMLLHVTSSLSKLVHKYIIHIKANRDVWHYSRWSTNILQEQIASIFRAKRCLFYPEDGGNRFHQNVDTHTSNHTASHIARQCSQCSPAWESYTVKICIHDTILSCSVIFWIKSITVPYKVTTSFLGVKYNDKDQFYACTALSILILVLEGITITEHNKKH